MSAMSSVKYSRQSNLELLRIVSMLMILLLHLNGITVSTQWFSSSSVVGTSILSLQSLMMVAVNCFILLSGYFGIRPSVAGFAKLYLWWWFYSAISIIVGMVTDGVDMSWEVINDLFNPFSSRQWFVKTYLLLYLMSPIFNSAIKCFSRTSLAYSVFVMLTADIWFGWIDEGQYGFGQYGLLHMVTIYLLGAYIGRYGLPHKRLSVWLRRAIDITLYLSCSLISTMIALKWGWQNAFAYNSPCVIIGSLAFFDLFLTFAFHSSMINRVALSAFSVYLLHHGNSVWNILVAEALARLSSADDYCNYIILWVPIVAIIIYLMSLIIDYVRSWLTEPVIDRIKHLKINNL